MKSFVAAQISDRKFVIRTRFVSAVDVDDDGNDNDDDVVDDKDRKWSENRCQTFFSDWKKWQSHETLIAKKNFVFSEKWESEREWLWEGEKVRD